VTSSFAVLRHVAREQGVEAALTKLIDLLPIAALPGEWIVLPVNAPEPDANLPRVKMSEVLSDNGKLLVWRVVVPNVNVLDCGRSSNRASISLSEGDALVRADDANWRVGVAWVRLGLCERLAVWAVERLQTRTINGMPAINLPTIRLVLADAALAHLEVQTLLTQAAFGADFSVSDMGNGVSSGRLERITSLLDRTSHAVLNLFGASGFVDGKPSRLARTADLLGHASGNLPPETHGISDERGSK
jgi:alkylation response protein AidB-like acyl-CoA dehydrogenase